MRHLCLLLALFGSLLRLSAQQYPLFSNFQLNPLGFNPALAGTTEFPELYFTYRTQWVGLQDAPATQILSGQARLQRIPVGVGGLFYNDAAGKFRRSGVSMLLSYRLDFSDGGFWSVGAAGGFYNLRLDGDYQAAIQTDPTLAGAQSGQWTPDLMLGTFFRLPGGAWAGFSVPQLLRRSFRFEDDEQNPVPTELIPHYYAMLGYELFLSEGFQLEPHALLKITRNAPAQVDVGARAVFGKRFWLGGTYRTGDALSALIGYNIGNRFRLGYAFDFTLSTLNQHTDGSHEITLALRLGKVNDRDGDGIPDDEDQCPEEPGTPDNNGCPELPVAAVTSDRDRDGVPDDADKCPDIAGIALNQGCPFDDKDNDGLRDDLDKCPDAFGIAANEGCPLYDSDQDGIVDSSDPCPNIPGPLQNMGCPMTDQDNDGVPDEKDQCPTTPGPVALDGCPAITAAERESLRLAIQNLFFDTDSDRIRPEGYQSLDRLAQTLLQRPEMKIRIRGHADQRGDELYNLELSKRRAEAVMYYLLNRGVKREQLVVEYYGESQPLDPRPSEASLQLNRRVEMEFFFN
ncbi:MAG: type IX secretion system membrane protein PorP/SprF [Bacteroidetes bacterium]|nr:MAG: type IX secretion system membrane protein PorP/SprF [Bacteroidota bacterium]